jgi:hypothetical protein
MKKIFMQDQRLDKLAGGTEINGRGLGLHIREGGGRE